MNRIAADLEEPPTGGWSRLASSILVKVLAATVAALVLSSATTAFVAARFARDALARQARQLAASHLRILREDFGQRERELLVDLRSLAEAINVGALTDPQRHDELVGQLGRAANDFQLAMLEVVDGRAAGTPPLAAVGHIASSPDIGDAGAASPEPTSRLLATDQGGYVQAVPVAVGDTPFYLLGGYDFDSGFAYELRRQLGDVDDVVLVAGATVVGDTVAQPLTRPPALVGGRLPSAPAPASVGPTRRLMAYVSVGSPADSVHRGAIGVAQADPVAPLTRSLARQRLVTTVILMLVAGGLAWLLFRSLMRPLVQLAHTARRVAGGDPTASFTATGADEVGMLARALEAMRTQLATRLTVIGRQAGELQQGSRRTVTAQDEERQRIARDLHDGVQQQLVILRMHLGMLTEGAANAAEAPLGELGQALDRVIEQLREVSHNLYPSILMDRGITAALYSYLGRLPVSTRLSLDPDPMPRLPLPIESGAYFMLCEALTNALKHSGATEVSVAIRLDGDRLDVSVTDNGQGFVPGRPSRSGLLHMEDRARSFGGTLTIVSRPGAGTCVVATFQVERTEASTVDGGRV